MEDVTTTLKTVWNGDITGNGNIKTDFLETDLAIPKNLGGNGEGTEPKELLISSATACFVMTLTGMLQGRKIAVEKITVDTEATKTDEEFNILHSPHITLAADATNEHIESAQRTIELANEKCEVGNILRQAGIQIKADGEVSTN